jgi:hypothetical protein
LKKEEGSPQRHRGHREEDFERNEEKKVHHRGT